MLKIRLQGTTKDLKWFLKILARDKRFVANKPSEPMDIKGSNKYKRVQQTTCMDADTLEFGTYILKTQ